MNAIIILKAIRFAEEKHKGQKRKVSGEDYITHPILASYFAGKYKDSHKSSEIIAAAILHDVLEDTDTSYMELVENFGSFVASLVHEVTSDTSRLTELGKLEYLKYKCAGISNYALFIKLCDRLSNLLDHPSDKIKSDTKEILEYIRLKRKLTKSHKRVIKEIEKLI